MALPELAVYTDLTHAAGAGADALIIVAPGLDATEPTLRAVLEDAARLDKSVATAVSLVAAAGVPGGRLVFAPCGPLTRDTDDVRTIGDAAKRGVRRAKDAGAVAPAVLVSGLPSAITHGPAWARAVDVALLEGAGTTWEPLEAREALGAGVEPIERVGLVTGEAGGGGLVANVVRALEAGRRAARDVCGTEPERMAPPRMVEYVRGLFPEGSAVRVSVVDERSTLSAEYPLVDAVARASWSVPRHHPRIIRLEYVGDGPIERTLLLAGKGLSYDTGGADLKTDGHMAGMSRDKGGAAAVVGLFEVAEKLRPKHVRLVAEIGAVRNSIGPDAFVSDEILKSHAGVRVRIGNTDAEGRLVLADLLSHLRVEAETAVAPVLMSIATLTGHAGRAVGPYSIAIANGPARDAGHDTALQEHGDRWGDVFELSRLRREDFDFIKPRSSADDVLSCNNAPSSATARGHQFPAAFLVVASGLDKHARASAKPIPFVHIDIGGSGIEGGDWQHGRPTAAPVVALASWLGLV
jgi:leucyl aminopeptidase